MIVRKIIEDDKEIRAVSRKNKWEEPPLETMKYRIPVWQLPYIGEADPIGYNFVASDYDYESAKNVQYDLSIMCNKIIHSNIWSIVYDGRKKMDSIAFSSDKEKAKESYVIELKDWLCLFADNRKHANKTAEEIQRLFLLLYINHSIGFSFNPFTLISK